jgi:hypothetical protein
MANNHLYRDCCRIRISGDRNIISERGKTVLNQQTMSILYSLKLTGMARSLEERLADPQQAALSHDDFVGLLVFGKRKGTH